MFPGHLYGLIRMNATSYRFIVGAAEPVRKKKCDGQSYTIGIKGYELAAAWSEGY
jgi:hypothetical protein